MSTLTFENSLPAALPAFGDVRSPQEEQIRVSVQLALACQAPPPRRVERRRFERHAFPHLIHLTPLLSDHQPASSGTIVVIGRHLGERGLDFYHREVLPFRRGIVSLQAGDEWIGLLFEILWTRFNGHGWYDTGGRFLAVAQSPLCGTLADLPIAPR